MSNYSVSAADPNPDPESTLWLGILYAICAAVGIPANLTVLLLTVTNKGIRAVPLNICIFSLAFSNMMTLASYISSTVLAITYNVVVCKVMGVGVYVFQVMSLMLPACISICRYAAICSSSELNSTLKALQNRKGIFLLNAIFWTYALTFTLPFIIADKFGFDVVGVCGVAEIDTIFLWVYYLIIVVGALFVSYAISFTFYRKLGKWVEETSSLITISEQTRDTLTITHNVMRMIKWLLFVPVVFYYPALCVQGLLRIFPNIVSVPTARIFMSTATLPNVVDPFVTMIFVKPYRKALLDLLFGRNNVSTINSHHSARITPEQVSTM